MSAVPHGSVDLADVRSKIYPRAVTGVFARWRWAMVWITQAVFYGLPWLRWNGRPAVLFELDERRFHLFGAVLYPQDFFYLTGLMVIGAIALFVFTAVAGRLWCGYGCPQTVYTEVFLWIERVVEGDRAKRIRLDRDAVSARKLGLKTAKHGLWLLVSLWTGVTFVGYFSGIAPLVASLVTLQSGPWETFWVGFYGFATYGNAGFLREQVCKYMCPYARLQSAMITADTLVITYDPGRGEPRGPRSKKADPRSLGLGDCVDCGMCVEVCPTGIDIRKGIQNECIGCAACADACDQVMARVGYPKGLIRYDTANGLRRGWSREDLIRHVLRPRVLAMAGLLVALTVALFTHLAMRVPLKADVLRDRGVLAREVEDGLVENVYRIQLMNPSNAPRRMRIEVSGLPTAFIATEREVEVEGAGHRMVPVRVRAQHGIGSAGANPIEFRIEAVDDAAVSVREKSTFFMPR